MSQPLLSILIPTTPDRVVGMENLLNVIGQNGAYRDAVEENKKSDNWSVERCDLVPKVEVEIIIICDNKEITIGEKRELLYKKAFGKFAIQIDSDDMLAEGAVRKILQAIESNLTIPCITFRERCMMNGEYRASNHSIKYEKWQDNFDGFDYVRCPFYKDVIRTDIAKSVPFPKIRYNEDELWSMAIKPLLTAEIHINEELYHYIYEPKESHEERYGIKD